MTRLPIRVRLTVAFATAMLLMLGAAALFVYVRLADDLNDRIDATLRARAEVSIASQARGAEVSGSPLEDPEEAFVQTIDPSGRVLATAGDLRAAALSPVEVGRAAITDIIVERRLPGVDGRARILGRPIGVHGAGVVVAVGQSLNDRNDALSNVVHSFVLGGAVAVAVASAIGYALARAGLAPVDAMRRRACEVSLRPGEAGLPLPRAHDEVRRLGETLNEMLERLRGSFERERRFVADASHELRTPVAVIRTELEGALLTGHYGDDVRESLVGAIDECDHLARLAEDLLVLARAADGQFPMQPETIPLDEFLDTIRAEFVDRAASEGRFIGIEVQRGLSVVADPRRLRQVVANLVDNSLRHGAGDLEMRARRHQDGVEFEVADDGPGFSLSFADHAFERFARDDPARRGEGVGLGLAIVHAIVTAHGGTATVTAGRPCRVRLWVPHQTGG